MKKPGIALLVAMMGAMLFVGSAFATPIITTNTRPVPVQPAFSGEPTLHSCIGQIFSTSPPNVVTDQSPAAMWGAALSPMTTIPTLIFEYTSNAASQKFGIWFGSDTSSIYTYDIFKGPAIGVGIGFPTHAGLEIVGNTISVFAFDCAMVNCGVATDSHITASAFGFYLDLGNGTKYYTADQLNGGTARSLAITDASGTNWAFAFEDGSDFDYQDMVVKVESIKATTAAPEPGTLLLLASGLAGLGGIAWRHRRG